MKIACLGWGSLIWRPENLLIQDQWFQDGPLLPIEFVRQSKNGRLTLVINEISKPIQTLWALMATDDLTIAKTSLLKREREGIPNEKLPTWIGAITTVEDTDDQIKLIIQNWAKNIELDAVIWTNLPPKFNCIEGRIPSLEEAISYLQSITDNKTKELAKEYIRRTPKQIDTEYRREFEKLLGWTFLT